MQARRWRHLAVVMLALATAPAFASTDPVVCGEGPVSWAVRDAGGPFDAASIRDGAPMEVSRLENAVLFRANDLLEQLLQDPEEVRRHGADALVAAAVTGNLKAIGQLIAAGVPPDGAGEYGLAIDSAIQNGCKEEVSHLLSHGADVNARTSLTSGRLFLAVSIARYDIAELLIASGYATSASEKAHVLKLLRLQGKQDIYQTLFHDQPG